MDRRERQEILGQWGVREPTERELAEGKRVAADLAGSPAAGRALPVRPRLFRPEVDSYVASLGGPLPYMQRLREIDRLIAEIELKLDRTGGSLRQTARSIPISSRAAGAGSPKDGASPRSTT